MINATYASDMMIYPANGQNAEQQKTDEGECFIWARDETGIDPMTQQATAPTAAKLSQQQQAQQA